MKKSLLLLVLQSALCLCYSQDYDLIVKSDGDSIACKIDSITEEYIYFEMQDQGRWIHTHADLAMISHYEENSIVLRKWVFKPGSSYMLSTKESIQSGLKRNNIQFTFGTWLLYTELMFSYERMIRDIYQQQGVSWWIKLGGGISGSWEWGGAARCNTGVTMLSGSKNNHLEIHAGITSLIGGGDLVFLPAGTLGYRYQKPGDTFLFRTGVGFPEGIYLGIGGCF